VGPREVDDAAQVVLADHLGRAGHAVERHVALVGGRRVGAVDVLDEELADLLLQRHPREPGGHPAVLAAGAWLAGRGAAGTPTAGERRPGDAEPRGREPAGEDGSASDRGRVRSGHATSIGEPVGGDGRAEPLGPDSSVAELARGLTAFDRTSTRAWAG